MEDSLNPRARRALAVIGGALLLLAAAGAYWLRGEGLPARPPLVSAPAPPLPVSVTGWQFTDPAHGWVLLSSQTDPISRLFATTDAGLHWQALASWRGMEAFSFHFFDPRRGAVQVRDPAGRSGLLYTEDAGRSWRRGEVPPAQFAPGELTLADPDHAYLFTGDGVYATGDGARTWALLAVSGLPGYPRALGFRDGRNGWATAAGGGLYRTRDGGRTWVSDPLPGPPPSGLAMLPLAFASRAALLVTSPRRGAAEVRPVVYASPDGGETWDPARPAQPDAAEPLPTPLTAFADHDHWFSPAPSFLWSSADAGRTWEARAAQLPAGLQLGEVRFPDPRHGWSLTEHPYGTPALLRTTDGGASWTEVQLPRLG